MNASLSQFGAAGRGVALVLGCFAALFVMAALLAASHGVADADQGGAASSTPNLAGHAASQQAAASGQGGAAPYTPSLAGRPADRRARATDQGGAAPYTPTKGEWLCMLLNSRQALVNCRGVPSGADAEYLYDPSKPDTITIRLIFIDGTNEAQLRRLADYATRHVTEAAKIRGWDGWLKTEVIQQNVSFEASTDDLVH
jgi:hypothetical protein